MPFFAKVKQKIFKYEFSRFQKKILAVFSVVGLFVFFFPHTAAAAEFIDGSWTIAPILKIMLKIDSVLLSVAETIFSWIVVPNNMTAVMNNSAVYTMWRFVRDFFNTTLIMILLFSAFATVFGASTGYHYKKVLLNLVIMALLVNFSYPIARFIIDVSNVFMYGFLNQLGGSGSFMSIINASHVKDIITSGQNMPKPDISYLFAAVIFTFMFAITLVTIAILLVVRTVALTVFIIFSPIAFLGTTQPGTDLASAASGWWKEFMKYCFAGPIMVFMLVLANQMMIGISSAANGLGTIAKLQANDAALSGLISSISFFSIPLVILWIGIEKAQKSGIAGSEMVVGQGMKLMSWTGKTLSGYRAGRWVATKAVPAVTKAGLEKFDETYLMPHGLSPTAFIEGWKQRAKSNRADALNPATGNWHDKFNKWLEGTKTSYGQLEKERVEAGRLKELKEISTHSGVLLKNGIGLAGLKSDTAIQDWRAIIKILYSQRDQDDFMHYIKDHYTDPILAGGKSFKDLGIGLDEKGNFDESLLGVGGWNADQAAAKILESCGDNKEQIDKFLLDLGEIGGSTKGIGYGGANIDKDGHLTRAANKWAQAQAAVAKLSTAGEVQALAKETHRNYITSENIGKDGLTIINPEFDSLVRTGILGNIKENVNRHAPTFYQKVGSKETVGGMRKRLNELKSNGGEVWVTGRKDVNGKPLEDIVEIQKITPEQYEQASQWVNALEIYTRTGKKTAGMQTDIDDMNKALHSAP